MTNHIGDQYDQYTKNRGLKRLEGLAFQQVKKGPHLNEAQFLRRHASRFLLKLRPWRRRRVPDFSLQRVSPSTISNILISIKHIQPPLTMAASRFDHGDFVFVDSM
ncbi:hypothetical protein PIB30_060742 [Stylosanthes scabra]|uniref:Uncharacterized protein n=1 Tax=Stylosanthes scabra TaxID=79078 RepID=A0ABU6SLI5_9FABA|nr:hypothetical protein [Stylosanthes scabra]